MVHLIAGLAALLCTIFTGATIYITFVEHPARVSLGTEAAARQFGDRLLAPGRDLASAETGQLLDEWGRLHAVRSALGLAASILFLYALAHV
jgi:hypothetical protein